MRRTGKVTDTEIDRLLAGQGPIGDEPDSRAVAAFVEAVSNQTGQPVPDDVRSRHLASIVDESQAVAAGLVPARSRRAAGLLPQRRKTVLSVIFASLAGKIAAGALVASAAAGGAAATGNLPDPAQDAAASVASRVGVTLPVSADAAERRDAEHRQDEERRQDDGATERRVDGDVRDAVDGDYEHGREKGEHVSDAASQNRRDGEVKPDNAGPPSEPGQPEEVPASGHRSSGSDQGTDHRPSSPGQSGDAPAGGDRSGQPENVPAGGPR